jgi:hypothetical protein
LSHDGGCMYVVVCVSERECVYTREC